MNIQNNTKFLNQCFWGILIFKIVLLLFFSSDYQNQLFIPFIEHFLGHFDNPWQHIYDHPEKGIEFPYSPVMLYILSIFYLPAYLINTNAPWINNFFIKLPTLLADLLIYRLLLHSIGDKKKVLMYYFSAPIIIYACYMHSQVDLIPTAFLFSAVYLLTKKKRFVVGHFSWACDWRKISCGGRHAADGGLYLEKDAAD